MFAEKSRISSGVRPACTASSRRFPRVRYASYRAPYAIRTAAASAGMTSTILQTAPSVSPVKPPILRWQWFAKRRAATAEAATVPSPIQPDAHQATSEKIVSAHTACPIVRPPRKAAQSPRPCGHTGGRP